MPGNTGNRHIIMNGSAGWDMSQCLLPFEQNWLYEGCKIKIAVHRHLALVACVQRYLCAQQCTVAVVLKYTEYHGNTPSTLFHGLDVVEGKKRTIKIFWESRKSKGIRGKREETPDPNGSASPIAHISQTPGKWRKTKQNKKKKNYRIIVRWSGNSSTVHR